MENLLCNKELSKLFSKLKILLINSCHKFISKIYFKKLPYFLYEIINAILLLYIKNIL
jgi:hypothetical protein